MLSFQRTCSRPTLSLQLGDPGQGSGAQESWLPSVERQSQEYLSTRGLGEDGKPERTSVLDLTEWGRLDNAVEGARAGPGQES